MSQVDAFICMKYLLQTHSRYWSKRSQITLIAYGKISQKDVQIVQFTFFVLFWLYLFDHFQISPTECHEWKAYRVSWKCNNGLFFSAMVWKMRFWSEWKTYLTLLPIFCSKNKIRPCVKEMTSKYIADLNLLCKQWTIRVVIYLLIRFHWEIQFYRRLVPQ